MAAPAPVLFLLVLLTSAASPSGRTDAHAGKSSDAGATVAERFERGKIAFARGEYARAIALLRPLVHPDILLDTEADVVQADRMLGVAYLFEDQPDNAREEFRHLIELQPDYRFDALLDPPRIVDFFDAVVKEEEAEASLLDKRRKQRDTKQAPTACEAVAPASGKSTLRHAYAVNFIPFGAGQFQNDQRRKGWTFFGVEMALGVLSAGAFVTNFALFGVRPQRGCLAALPPTSNGLDVGCPPEQIDHHDENVSRNLLRLQVGTGILFFGAVAWGIIDAARHYVAVVPDETPSSVHVSWLGAGLGPGGWSLRF